MNDQDYASPGPIYDVMGATGLSKTTGRKIGKSHRTKINHWVEETHSPNNYNPEKSTKQQTISIPKYQPTDHPNNVPDCGWYNPSSKLIRPQTGNYSMGSRYCSIMDDIKPYPGPAAYQTNCSSLARSKSAKNVGFSTAKRFTDRNNHPGVGDYQIAGSRGMVNNKGSIGRGEREPVKRPNYPSRKHLIIKLTHISKFHASMIIFREEWASLCLPNCKAALTQIIKRLRRLSNIRKRQRRSTERARSILYPSPKGKFLRGTAKTLDLLMQS